mmetsp:Transcript_3342/g.6339  ORF Transcript_3342/g.6339 Transcript_3342/m.6339 type:complete len:100 (+) Transcript_3342:2760-3059(+)
MIATIERSPPTQDRKCLELSSQLGSHLRPLPYQVPVPASIQQGTLALAPQVLTSSGCSFAARLSQSKHKYNNIIMWMFLQVVACDVNKSSSVTDLAPTG